MSLDYYEGSGKRKNDNEKTKTWIFAVFSPFVLLGLMLYWGVFDTGLGMTVCFAYLFLIAFPLLSYASKKED